MALRCIIARFNLRTAVILLSFCIAVLADSSESECTTENANPPPVEASSLLQKSPVPSRKELRKRVEDHHFEQLATVSTISEVLDYQAKQDDKTTSTMKMQSGREQTSGGGLSPYGWMQMKMQSGDEETSGGAPCTCESANVDWVKPEPREPRCIFIDLGAADGNTLQHFLANGYTDVPSCPSGGQWEAILVEANPAFNEPLEKAESENPGTAGNGRVRTFRSSAAYMCEGETTFYLDTVDVKQHYWGSSMSPNTRDVQRSGKKKVKVPLVNLNRLIMESTLPDDYVLLKMDIEGSEHDILPCLAKSKAAHLVDAMYVEKHPFEWSIAGAKKGDLETAVTQLEKQGVYAPDYDSPSL